MSDKLPTLFEIDRQLEETVEAIETARELGHGAMQDAFENDLKELLLKHTQKVDNFIGSIRRNEAYTEAIDDEILRLKILKERTCAKIEYMKKTAEMIMLTNGMDEMPGNLGRKFWFRESKAVKVLDETLIPEHYKQTTYQTKIKKDEILSALKDGLYVPGTELETRLNIQVK